jgi:acetylornithine deacetylase
MTRYLTDWFQRLGVPVETREVAPARSNVIGRYEAPKARRVVLFDAHQDTVPTDGMIIPPFTPTVSDGKLYGRGSCDVKGGMAAMLTAFERLVKERPAGSASLVMVCTVDEEFTHVGSSYLAANPVGADVAIVAEPTQLNLVDRHKGAVRWKIRAKGVACHSSTPHLGKNAIYRMAEVVAALADYARELSVSPPDPVLGPPSLSVGRIEGGQSVNVVPDWAEIEIDRRVIPGEAPEQARQRAIDALEKRLGSLADLEFMPPWVKMPALTPRFDAWVPPICRAIERAVGRQPAVQGVPYGTDGGPLAESGLPSFVFGPGDIAQAHTKDEFIELDQLRAAVDAYHEIVCELGKTE